MANFIHSSHSTDLYIHVYHNNFLTRLFKAMTDFYSCKKRMLYNLNGLQTKKLRPSILTQKVLVYWKKVHRIRMNFKGRPTLMKKKQLWSIQMKMKFWFSNLSSLLENPWLFTQIPVYKKKSFWRISSTKGMSSPRNLWQPCQYTVFDQIHKLTASLESIQYLNFSLRAGWEYSIWMACHLQLYTLSWDFQPCTTSEE